MEINTQQQPNIYEKSIQTLSGMEIQIHKIEEGIEEPDGADLPQQFSENLKVPSKEIVSSTELDLPQSCGDYLGA
jgi:hypothetical protein